MTAGEDALTEAARLETARIYSRLSTENDALSTPLRTTDPQDAQTTVKPPVDIQAARRRKRTA